MSGNNKYILPFNYMGSKFGQLDRLIPLIPKPSIDNIHFAEIFGGSAVLTLNIQPYRINTVNDINGLIINFFKVLRDYPEELISKLELTPHSYQEYLESWNYSNDPIERARQYYVRLRQSFGSMGAQKKSKGWSMATKITRCKISEATNKWLKGIDNLDCIVDRLRCLQLDNRDFRVIIPLLNQKTTILYLDPPYDFELSPSSKDYLHTMSEEDHYDLAELAKNHIGKAIVSGYKSKLMMELYRDWYFTPFPNHIRSMGSMSRNSKTKKSVKQECIWTNYDPFTLNHTLFNHTTP